MLSVFAKATFFQPFLAESRLLHSGNRTGFCCFYSSIRQILEAVRGAKIVFIGEVEPFLRILTFTNPKGMNILSYVIMVLRKCVRRINFLEMNGLNPFLCRAGYYSAVVSSTAS